MGYIKSFIYEFKNTYTVDDRLIILLFASIFLHWGVTSLVVAGGAIYVLTCSNFLETVKRVKGAKTLLFFGLYLLVISLLNQNWLGAGLSVGVLLMAVVVLHTRRYIHKQIFEQALDIMILFSLISVVYAVFEQFYYMSQIEGMGFLDIQNKPQYRVHTFFFNANYYAMMILFVEMICIYKFFIMKEWQWKVYYMLIGVANLFALFLTGGRIAWLCLGAGALVMVFFNKWYKTFVAIMAAGAGVVGLLMLKPGLLPRLAARGLKLERRKQIWQTAVLMIQDSWLFGRGPLTYYYTYASYTKEYIATYGIKSYKQYKLGISSQHAHTMFLEPIVSFGIVGTIILLVYLGGQCKRVISLFTKKIDHTLGAFLLGILAVTICFCIIDFPIFWVQTGFLFLMLLGCADMYSKEMNA